MKTETQTPDVVNDKDLPKEPGEANLALHRASVPAAPLDMGVLESLGFIAPIASPEHLRAAFDYQHRMFSAILADTDYLYVVSYKNGNKTEQRTMTSYAEAMGLYEKFTHLNSTFSAKPKKSGIVKLARALGITAERVVVRGLPEEPLADYSYVEYRAIHAGTNKQETGVGWCDRQERNGRISTHDVIATADTRAYNRAVLRLAGFGDVSADEIVAGASDSDEPIPEVVPVPARAKEMHPLPALNSDEVMAAASAWANGVISRGAEGLAPAAQQSTHAARDQRAKARRGNANVAYAMGALGIDWQGAASDGKGYPTYTVEPSPVSIEEVQRVKTAASAPAAPKSTAEMAKAAVQGQGTKGVAAEPEKGWDLSGKGSQNDDPKPAPEKKETRSTSTPASTVAVPPPSPGTETITTKQAKKVSSLLKQLFTAKEDMVSWLEENCRVNSTIKLHTNQYEATIASLNQIIESKE